MADYNREEIKIIEEKWRKSWEDRQIYRTVTDPSRPKYYVLDMFPYPSGAGLHVGHPLGYIASDIVARYKRLKGYNVLHPMGFDAFGLPAEQYAIQTGQHPAITTARNIETYKQQLRRIGFSFDWSREIQTCDPAYYKWTQWIFMQLFNAWYNKKAGPMGKAEPISTLIAELEKNGNRHVDAACDDQTPVITAHDWKNLSDREKENFLQHYRLAYRSETMVNWCPGLGTVLSNDEVKDGVSERGGYPVERISMMQWSMRITAYAERLLAGLEVIDWPEPVKEMQRNWIGKSRGCEFSFTVNNHPDEKIRVFTTRIDTVFGATFIVLAPEHELVEKITTPDRKADVAQYVYAAKNRSERERISDVKRVTGVFTGAYAVNPFNNAKIPVWVADYVLAGYGTGAVMAVPGHDERDHRFARHFNLPVIQVVEGPDVQEKAFDSPEGKIMNSAFMNGLSVAEAIEAGIRFVTEKGIGREKINYRLRDAIFGRQRYWGEPFPVYFDNGIPKLVDEQDLPITLPEIDEYKPTEKGEPPLGRAKNWKYKGRYPYELTTMPGWAGSSWYWFRYMDPRNKQAFCGKEHLQYWKDVDLYIGGAEHATGHLLYSRFWCKVLKDLGFVESEEPFKKLINQGHIQGMSKFVYRINGTNTFVSAGLKDKYQVTRLHADISLVNDNELDTEAFKKWRPDLAQAEFILEDGKYYCDTEVEKMSKSKHNVVNPDDIIDQYGADTLRLYEMFLGPLELSKPWNTNGIDGVFKFLRKFWNLFHADGTFRVTDAEPTVEELKILHRTLRKVERDIETYSFNTSVSEFMICVNELTSLKCNKRKILEPLVIALAPFAPHITEELWSKLGHDETVHHASYPAWNEAYLQESTVNYPISVNGKVRAQMQFAPDTPQGDIEKAVMASEVIQKWTQGKPPRKIIVVPGKIVNVVV
ncbi:MAG: leucine--tRNA ligase [Cyclobacteriaceae bacterium]|nr:MAG: leucine--tRNA ligase [Cyclobacteriaceae bacterium]